MPIVILGYSLKEHNIHNSFSHENPSYIPFEQNKSVLILTLILFMYLSASSGIVPALQLYDFQKSKSVTDGFQLMQHMGTYDDSGPRYTFSSKKKPYLFLQPLCG
jgi:hypothetical protein